MKLRSAMLDAYSEHRKVNELLDQMIQAMKDLMRGFEPGKIKAHLEEQTTQKDFDKIKRKWKDHLDKADIAVVNLDTAINDWQGKIEKCYTVLEEVDKENAATNAALKSVAEQINKINSWYTELGNEPLEKPRVETWSGALKVYLDARGDIDEEKRDLGLAKGILRSHEKLRKEANDDFLEAKFVDPKKKVKPGKGR